MKIFKNAFTTFRNSSAGINLKSLEMIYVVTLTMSRFSFFFVQRKNSLTAQFITGNLVTMRIFIVLTIRRKVMNIWGPKSSQTGVSHKSANKPYYGLSCGIIRDSAWSKLGEVLDRQCCNLIG